MSGHEIETKQNLIRWLKRIFGIMAILLWVNIIYTIAQSSEPFKTQAPYCMASTMLIFGLLSLVFKGLEYWEKNI